MLEKMKKEGKLDAPQVCILHASQLERIQSEIVLDMTGPPLLNNIDLDIA